MDEKIIQKDVTFDMSFTFPLFGYSKALSVLKENYNVEQIKKNWSWKNPFKIQANVRVSIMHDVNISKMREKQHELMTEKEE